MHGAATMVLSLVLVVLGLVMLTQTISRGGSPLSLGIIVGLCFCGLGAGRLYVAWRSARD